jgi:carbamoyltransferase
VESLINTSFNINGEPIAHTEADALKSAKAMGIDVVVVNGKLKID